jgi:hypothetical protein
METSGLNVRDLVNLLNVLFLSDFYKRILRSYLFFW